MEASWAFPNDRVVDVLVDVVGDLVVDVLVDVVVVDPRRCLGCFAIEIEEFPPKISLFRGEIICVQQIISMFPFLGNDCNASLGLIS